MASPGSDRWCPALYHQRYKKEAEQTAAKMKLSPQQRIARMTYGEAIDLYISKYEKELSPSTVNTYKSIRKNRFQTLMDMPINVGVDMQAVINQESVKPSTLRPAYSLLSASLKDLNIDPPKVRFPKQAKKNVRFWIQNKLRRSARLSGMISLNWLIFCAYTL